ncbi:hypothetical protein L6452_06366 [Arctium lappa]|uniref:Uncharacterized protein n=1 Tax=Arctium lappa TaxID=4217 RepID=A0ACB9EIP7_ARCLA|nr:hypothetical protein L6452_06366 [Arctium lappa]
MAAPTSDGDLVKDDRISRITSAIRVIPDFPKPGILFQDITTLLLDPVAFKDTIDLFVERYKDKDISVVAGVEARGFIFGPPIALAIGAKFVPMRKPNKLPVALIRSSSSSFLFLLICSFHSEIMTSQSPNSISGDGNGANGSNLNASAYSNPLFLSHNDNPGVVIVSQKFDGKRFGAWKRAMILALSVKNKLGFVTGRTKEPAENDPTYEDWERCNSIVITWILNAVTTEISEGLIYYTSAKAIWKQLHLMYEQSNLVVIFQLQKELNQMSQGSDSITSYYSKFKRAWDEFASMDDMPDCSCTAAELWMKRLDRQQLMQFLFGLNDSYAITRGMILHMKPTPVIAEAYAILIQEEQQREVSAPLKMNINAVAMMANKNASASESFKFNNPRKSTANAVGDGTEITSKDYNQIMQFLNQCKINDVVNVVPKSAQVENDSNLQSELPSTGETSGFAACAGPSHQEALDVWGPFHTPTCEGHRYFLTMVDDHSRTTWVHLLSHKSSAFSIIQSFVQFVQSQFHKVIRSDNAKELGNSKEGKSFFESKVTTDSFPSNHNVTPNPTETNITQNEPTMSEPIQPFVQEDVTQPTVVPNSEAIPILRRSERTHKTPAYLYDFVCNQVSSDCSAFLFDSCHHTMTNMCISTHNSNPIALNSFSQSFVAHIINVTDPKTYEEAVSNPFWQEAMAKEFAALEANHTWKLVPLPEGKRAIGCKWVFKTKFKQDGTIERYKARLVAQGFTQRANEDYFETFSPVVKFTTIRCIVALAVKKQWNIHQLDINNAFLHGDLNEEVYMKRPKGMLCSNPNFVCKLEKSLYGLKQASRQWYSKLSEALKSKGFLHSKNDYSLFLKKTASSFTIVAVYVDDVIVTGDTNSEIDNLKTFLHDTFKIKDLGQLNYFLGLEFLRGDNGMFLTQKKYLTELLQEYGIVSSEGVTTPLPCHLKLIPDMPHPLDDPSKYRQLVGKLNFLVHTRPDLAFSVQYLSQFNQNPSRAHWDAVIHVLKYLKAFDSYGLFFNNKEDFSLGAYCDSDWASCPFSRRSVSGYFVSFGGSPISWKSKKQVTVSLSFAEAEFRSMRRITAELTWLSRLLSDLGVENITPIALKCDNMASIHIANNPVFHERTKHIELDCYYVREQLQAGVISVNFTPTTSQLADVFTKSLSGPAHSSIIHKLGLTEPPA